jgi:hypothetical protein
MASGAWTGVSYPGVWLADEWPSLWTCPGWNQHSMLPILPHDRVTTLTARSSERRMWYSLSLCCQKMLIAATQRRDSQVPVREFPMAKDLLVALDSHPDTTQQRREWPCECHGT